MGGIHEFRLDSVKVHDESQWTQDIHCQKNPSLNIQPRGYAEYVNGTVLEKNTLSMAVIKWDGS